jgi:hypothetical protein
MFLHGATEPWLLPPPPLEYVQHNLCHINVSAEFYPKVQIALEQETKAQRGSPLSLTSGLDGVGGLTPRAGRFTPGKESRYPLYRRLGGLQGRYGRIRKISPRTVGLVASRYTDWVIPVHGKCYVPAMLSRSIYLLGLITNILATDLDTSKLAWRPNNEAQKLSYSEHIWPSPHKSHISCPRSESDYTQCAQPQLGGTCCTRHNVMLPTKTCETRKRILILPCQSRDRTSNQLWKKCELFDYGNRRYSCLSVERNYPGKIIMQ